MLIFLAACAFLGAASSCLRCWLAWQEYRRGPKLITIGRRICAAGVGVHGNSTAGFPEASAQEEARRFRRTANAIRPPPTTPTAARVPSRVHAEALDVGAGSTTTKNPTGRIRRPPEEAAQASHRIHAS
jgi:hypothetical protein